LPAENSQKLPIERIYNLRELNVLKAFTNNVLIGKTPEEGQSYFVDSINAWAEKEKLDKFNLFGKQYYNAVNNIFVLIYVYIGHSFGAYIAAHFALKNPEKIEKLILCDPWGG
jgi:pimeloyl-ACP methyl ester carboxylesterase